MSEPIEMGKARSVYSTEIESFRRELLFTLRQYDSCGISFEIKQHLRLKAFDLKQECLKRFRSNTAKIANNQLPEIGNSLRIRSMCTTELPIRTSLANDCSYSGNRSRINTPFNKLTYESAKRSCTNSHVLAFEKQLIEEIDRIIDSIDKLQNENRNDWLQPSKDNRSRHYYHSLYDDTGYSIPLYSSTSLENPNDQSWRWKFNHDRNECDKTEIERFYDTYLSTSEYLK
ncbi:hypothetical protein SSS_08114 [Sarcoptes scabiei]|uniref:Uncharacterized protein n=1 Tax=Sarcoptes scabiei TaxID=52283 RepID=A0A834RGN2_SARSC|nr:hypothetical protein SSS_08114 [Sarcoptes scabiei]